jgi:protein gp37
MAGLDWEYWDYTFNILGGCKAISPGCRDCYAAQIAGTKTWPWEGSADIYNGVTVVVDKRRVFNGEVGRAPAGHPLWMKPLRLSPAKKPKLGDGKPSLIFVQDMGELFYEKHSATDITRVCETVALSSHIGLLLTKRTARMSNHLTKQSRLTVRQWQKKLWCGFSAEDQECFDQRWADVRLLAQAGWFVFVSIAPMLGAVTLPADFLALGKRTWVIVGGEQGKKTRARPMDPAWARAIYAQCKAAGIPFFMRGMHTGADIPLDLGIRKFPKV